MGMTRLLNQVPYISIFDLWHRTLITILPYSFILFVVIFEEILF